MGLAIDLHREDGKFPSELRAPISDLRLFGLLSSNGLYLLSFILYLLSSILSIVGTQVHACCCLGDHVSQDGFNQSCMHVDLLSLL